MKRSGLQAMFCMLILLPLAGCMGDRPRVQTELVGYVIVSELSDPASHSATIIITLPQSSTPTDIKAAAEAVIATRRDRFERITVKSFPQPADLNGVPLAVSKFEGAGVDHVFTSPLPASERIQTH